MEESRCGGGGRSGPSGGRTGGDAVGLGGMVVKLRGADGWMAGERWWSLAGLQAPFDGFDAGLEEDSLSDALDCRFRNAARWAACVAQECSVSG